MFEREMTILQILRYNEGQNYMCCMIESAKIGNLNIYNELYLHLGENSLCNLYLLFQRKSLCDNKK